MVNYIDESGKTGPIAAAPSLADPDWQSRPASEAVGWITAVILFVMSAITGVYLIESQLQARVTAGDELTLPADSRQMMMTPLRRP